MSMGGMAKIKARTKGRVALVPGLVLAVVTTSLWLGTGNAGETHKGDYIPREPVMRRLTAGQYRNVISDIFGPDIQIGGRLEPDLREGGLYAVGAGHVSITAAGMEQYDQMARAIAAQVLDEQHRRMTMPCEPADIGAPDDACARQFLTTTGLYLFRRPLTATQADVYVAAANEATKIVDDFYHGLSLSLAAMLSSPQFLFRQQITEPEPDRHGQFRLDAWSKATQLSFFLWNSTPDTLLLEAARGGELNDLHGLDQQVRRMMASPRLETGVRAFFIDNFRFSEFETLTKDARLFPKFGASVAADAREQTLRTIIDLLLHRQEDYRKLFTTRKTFLTPRLGAIYRVPVSHSGPNGAPERWRPHEFSPSEPNIGILTHISFTGLHSPPGRGSPTIRGKAMREVMLCQLVPAPPAEVPFDIVQDITNPLYKTARERLTAHRREPVCAGCHNLMDPIGLALENFDGAGEYRQFENGVPIDPSGEFDTLPFRDFAELSELIAGSRALSSCLVNRLLSYARGRGIDHDERAWVEKTESLFIDGGYRLPDLMRRIATSDDFYRVAAPGTSKIAQEADPQDEAIKSSSGSGQ